MADPAAQDQCPHCGDPLTGGVDDCASDQALARCDTVRRCARCGFLYPCASRIDDRSDYRDHDLLPVDRYRLVSSLRGKGPGRVYLARHLVLDEPCVVKILSTVDPEYSEAACLRFVEEAKAGFRIKHPNVARVLDCDRCGDEWYFVMEHVNGTDLAAIVRTAGCLPWAQVVQIGIETADGLSAIHGAGLLHRDIKPSNLILCPDGSVKIADLGLSDFLHGAGGGASPQEGMWQGTPQYMAPEQRGAAVELDERTDIYGLGATLYHLLVGHPPTRGKGPLDYLTGGDTHAPVEWPRSLFPPIPKWMRQLVETCLSPNPSQRYESADALSQELREWIGPADADTGPYRMPGIGTPRGVVVLPFENLAPNRAHDWLATALAEVIHNTLLTIDGVQVVERQELMTLIGRMYAEPGAEVSNAQTLDAARRVGAASVVRGSFQVNGGRVLVTVSKLVADRPAGTLLTRATGAFADIIDLQIRVGTEVAAALGHSSRPKTVPDSHNSPFVNEHYSSAQAAFNAGQYEDAIEHALEGRKHDPDSVELLSLLGVCHSRLVQHHEAAEYHKQLQTIARQQDDPYRLVEATGNLGVMHYFMGEYVPAHELLRSASDMAAELNLLPLLAKQCNNMGFVLSKMERLNEADQAFEEAIRIKLSLGATASLISPHNGRGEIALQQGRHNDALQFYRQALTWARELNDRVNTGICHTHIGRCHAHMGDYDLAEQHLTTALEALGATEFWNGITFAYEQLAELHLCRKQPDAAFECVEKRIDLARRHANRHVEAAAWEQKSRAFEMAHRKDEAMDCLRKSIQLQQNKSPYDAVRTPSKRRGVR